MGGTDAETVATGRISRLVSRTAENVTVITAAQIEALNAHTLSDILVVIPGVHLENQTGPASGVSITIQGARFSHVLLVLDGVPFNNLADNFPDPGLIPAQIIERVEVAKGAASSSWGPALGGVISVITKSPDAERNSAGAASYSHGQNGTDDARGEISGTVHQTGYYLAGGYFGSGGFHPNTDAQVGSVYNKLTFALPRRSQAGFSLYYIDAHRGEFATDSLQASDKVSRLGVTISLNAPLSEYAEVELSARGSLNDSELDLSGAATAQKTAAERDAGASAKYLWHGSDNLLVLGVDYDYLTLNQNEAIRNISILSRSANRWGLYVNDSYTVGRLSLSPGVRYDVTGTVGNQLSPALGATWQAGENTTLRAYTAKGYSVPSFNIDSLEKVWTTQLGAETSAVPYLWLKATLFRNLIRVYEGAAGVERQVKQGVEAEVRTSPLFHTALSVGYTFVDARRRDDDSFLPEIPRHLVLIGGHYDDQRLLRVEITGQHVEWKGGTGRDGGFVWDGHLTATPFGRGLLRPQFFFSVRNAFNQPQYLVQSVQIPGRWVEGGVRCAF